MQFIDLQAQYQALKKDIDKNIHQVLDSSQYLMGEFIAKFEKELADYCGVKHCISCANGTDALQLALMAWNIQAGDAVFVPSFTFFSTAEVVSLLGATPIFIDVNEKTFNIDCMKLEKAIIQIKKEGELQPKAIIAVDLFGQPADYEMIHEIAKKYNIGVLEDAAQGFGGSINEKKACSLGDISTTSFFPAKPLGCYGDGGAIFTNDENIYKLLASLRIHGKGDFKYDNVRIGMNSRLDAIQAAILIPKLHAFKCFELNKRNEIAALYSEHLSNYVMVPYVKIGYISSWAQYTILLKSENERNILQELLNQANIPTMIYYPKPLHQQKVYRDYDFNLDDLSVCENLSKRCLSLPMHPYLNKDDQMLIIHKIIKYLKKVR